ncbi:MAG: hypothetical protein LBU32_08010 [Clostridiales bacterium]|nr:hypothetical protein [Clostridiales bacterium]
MLSAAKVFLHELEGMGFMSFEGEARNEIGKALARFAASLRMGSSELLKCRVFAESMPLERQLRT